MISKYPQNNSAFKLIKEMVDSKDLDLNPDFQRHMVWDAKKTFSSDRIYIITYSPPNVLFFRR